MALRKNRKSIPRTGRDVTAAPPFRVDEEEGARGGRNKNRIESLRGPQHTRGPRDTQLCLATSPQRCAEGAPPEQVRAQQASCDWPTRSEMG